MTRYVTALALTTIATQVRFLPSRRKETDMGTNFYWLGTPASDCAACGHHKEAEHGEHIGKRSAAGRYCWDCDETLCPGGKDRIHYSSGPFPDTCPRSIPLPNRDQPGTAFLWGLGTVRECIDCACLVAGGPTRCLRCARERKPVPDPEPEPEVITRWAVRRRGAVMEWWAGNYWTLAKSGRALFQCRAAVSNWALDQMTDCEVIPVRFRRRKVKRCPA